MKVFSLLLVVVGIINCVVSVTYPSMSCHRDSNYRNGFDGSMEISKQNDFLNGQYSYHDNHREDRRFKWRWCNPTTDTSPQTGSDISLPQTEYDEEWSRGCGGNSALFYASSTHSNHNEDRLWTFKCSAIDNKFMLRPEDCSYSGYKNDYDGVFDYNCPDSGVIRTIHSIHSSHREDRRFEFECCRMANNEYTQQSMTCIEDSNYRNNWGGSAEADRIGYFLNGQYSEHNNHREDRLFKFRWCKPSVSNFAYTEEQTLPKTAHDAEWTKSCSDFNDGHAAIIGIEHSEHSNHREDREWIFKCGLLDRSKYGLANCGYTGYLNNWDGVLDFDCPNSGVVRSIWSKHSNHREDRLWKFECCSFVEAKFDFSNAAGSWFKMSTCIGCGPFEYERSIGIETSQVETISNSYSWGIESTISAGFNYGIASGSISVTGSYSQTTANEMQTAFQQKLTITTKYTCDKTYFYQWRTSLDEKLPDVQAEKITVHANAYLCTNNPQPKCPLGWCDNNVNSDCTQCRNGATFEAVSPQLNHIDGGNDLDDDIGDDGNDIFDDFNDDEFGYNDYNDKNNKFTFIVTDNTFYTICGVMTILIVVNICCLCYPRSGNEKKRQYKVVSMASDSDF